MAKWDVNKEAQQRALYDIALRAAAAADGAQTFTNQCWTKAVILSTKQELQDIADAILSICGDDGRLNMYMYGDWMALDEIIKNDLPFVILVIGTDATQSKLGWNCGACGFKTCGEFNKHAREVIQGPTKGRGTAQGGPSCMWLLHDFGTKIVTAAATIYEAGVPTRIHTSYGSMAFACGYIDGAMQSMGLSIGPWGKETWDMWYNRPSMKQTFTLKDIYEDLRRCYPTHFAGFVGRGRPEVKIDPAWQAKGIYYAAVQDEEYVKKRKDSVGKLVQVTTRIRQSVQERKKSQEQ